MNLNQEHFNRLIGNYIEAVKNRDPVAHHLSAALSAIGKAEYIMPGMSYTHPSSFKRRQHMLNGVRGHELESIIRDMCEYAGFQSVGKYDKDNEPWPRVEFAFEIDKHGHIHFRAGAEGHYHKGIAFDLMKAQLCWHGHFLQLEVFDGGDFSDPRNRPEPVAFVDLPDHQWVSSGAISIDTLGLTDDDYRFSLSLMNRDGFPDWMRKARPDVYGGPMRTMQWWFDYAEIGGVWTRLPGQGFVWDGEWEGSTRTHVDEDAKDDLPPNPLPEKEEKTTAAKQTDRMIERALAHISKAKATQPESNTAHHQRWEDVRELIESGQLVSAVDYARKYSKWVAWSNLILILKGG